MKFCDLFVRTAEVGNLLVFEVSSGCPYSSAFFLRHAFGAVANGGRVQYFLDEPLQTMPLFFQDWAPEKLPLPSLRSLIFFYPGEKGLFTKLSDTLSTLHMESVPRTSCIIVEDLDSLLEGRALESQVRLLAALSDAGRSLLAADPSALFPVVVGVRSGELLSLSPLFSSCRFSLASDFDVDEELIAANLRCRRDQQTARFSLCDGILSFNDSSSSFESQAK